MVFQEIHLPVMLDLNCSQDQLSERCFFADKPHLRKERAVLQTDFPKANPFMRFVRSALSVVNGKLVVEPSGIDKSNIVMSLSGANSFIILPGGTRGYTTGEEVDVIIA